MSALTSSVRQPRSHVAFRPRRWSPVLFCAATGAHPVLGAACARRARAQAQCDGRRAPSDGQILAFAQLCRMLDRPFALAEIRAAAPPADGGLGVGGILLAAERLGFKARALKPRRHNLAGGAAALPGRRPGARRGLARDRAGAGSSAPARAGLRANHGVRPGRSRRPRGTHRADEAAREPRAGAACATPCSPGCARCCGSSASPRW